MAFPLPSGRPGLPCVGVGEGVGVACCRGRGVIDILGCCNNLAAAPAPPEELLLLPADFWLDPEVC